MSEKNVVEFLSKISTDDKAAQMLSKFEPNEAGWTKAATAAGFDCTLEEMQRVGRPIRAHAQSQAKGGQLTDSELGNVAGGALSFSATSYNFAGTAYKFNYINFSKVGVACW